MGRQIHRHYYVAKLCAYETLFQYNKDQANFVNSYETGVSKLSVFSDIHKLDDGEEQEQEPADFEDASSVEDDSLSFGEIEEQNHSLNTSIGSSQELENAESARNNETEAQKPVFNIANQMQLKVDQELDSSFDSNRTFSF